MRIIIFDVDKINNNFGRLIFIIVGQRPNVFFYKNFPNLQ